MRVYDRILSCFHVNKNAGHIIMLFTNPTFNGVYTKNQLQWQLPCLDFGNALAVHADCDKVLVAYDSNRLAVFDTTNKRVHPWTVANMNRMPANYLKRYNRILGIV